MIAANWFANNIILAVGAISTPIGLLGLTVFIYYKWRARRYKSEERKLELLPEEKRGDYVDASLKGYGVNARGASAKKRLELIQQELNYRYQIAKERHRVSAAVFVLCFILTTLAFAYWVSSGSRQTDLTQPTPSQPIGLTPPPAPDTAPGSPDVTDHTPTVLFVLGPDQFWGPDYYEVRKLLREEGVEVEVATPGPGPVNPAKGDQGEPVVSDLRLKGLDATKYQAIIFPGGAAKVYVAGEHQQDAEKIIKQMRVTKRIIAGVGDGVLILGRAGALRDPSVTVACQGYNSKELREKYGASPITTTAAIKNHNVVTGRGLNNDDHKKFVGELIKAIKAGPAK